jgi:hypothetical protein
VGKKKKKKVVSSTTTTILATKCTYVYEWDVYLQGGVIPIDTLRDTLPFWRSHAISWDLFFFFFWLVLLPTRCGTEMDTHTQVCSVCVWMMLAHFYLSSRCLSQQNFAASSAPCFFFLFLFLFLNFIIPHHFEVRWGERRRRSGCTTNSHGRVLP